VQRPTRENKAFGIPLISVGALILLAGGIQQLLAGDGAVGIAMAAFGALFGVLAIVVAKL
jgi:hypothetical protein